MRPPALLLAATTALGCGSPPPPQPTTPAAAIATRVPPDHAPATPEGRASPGALEVAPRAHIAIRGGGLADLAPDEATAVLRRLASALGAHPALTCDSERGVSLGLERYAIDVDAHFARRDLGPGAEADIALTLAISSPEDRLLTIWTRRAQVLGAPGTSTDRELWDLALESVLDGAADHVASVVIGAAAPVSAGLGR